MGVVAIIPNTKYQCFRDTERFLYIAQSVRISRCRDMWECSLPLHSLHYGGGDGEVNYCDHMLRYSCVQTKHEFVEEEVNCLEWSRSL